MMKIATYNTYGPPEVVRMEEAKKPVPANNEVLIKIYASTISAGDWRARSLDMPVGFGLVGRLVFGVFGPRNKILGTELSGIVEAVGDDVTQFSVGDAVIAYVENGCHAEYRAVPEDGPIILKPENLSFEQGAALCFGGVTALDFLQKFGELSAGETVLINGASGSVGSACVQLAKHFGATVTGVSSKKNHELLGSLGADFVIDYAQEDFTLGHKVYDIVVDCVGNAPWVKSKRVLSKRGRLLLVAGSLADMLKASLVSKKHGKMLVAGVSMGSRDKLIALMDIVEAGAFMPVIDRVYPIEDIVQAHAYVDSGRKCGNVVISMMPPLQLSQAAE